MTHPRLRMLLLNIAAAAMAKTKAWTWWLCQTLVFVCVVVLVTVILGALRGHDRGDSRSTQNAPVVSPAMPEIAGTQVAKRVAVFKPVPEDTVPEDTRYDALLMAGDALQEDVERFVEQLLQELSAHDAVHVRTLYRLHTTGHFLLELDDWAASTSHRAALSDEQQAELIKLLDRWSDLREQIIAFSKKCIHE